MLLNVEFVLSIQDQSSRKVRLASVVFLYVGVGVVEKVACDGESAVSQDEPEFLAYFAVTWV